VAPTRRPVFRRRPRELVAIHCIVHGHPPKTSGVPIEALPQSRPVTHDRSHRSYLHSTRHGSLHAVQRTAALLIPTGLWRAVLLSALLFGLGHLANSALRGLSLIILAQAFGAAVQGVGLAALRLRTHTLWPLIPLHALHDLFLQLGNLPISLVEVPIDTIFLIYGIILLRRRSRVLTNSDPHGQQ
jgi:hypothetical protein